MCDCSMFYQYINTLVNENKKWSTFCTREVELKWLRSPVRDFWKIRDAHSELTCCVYGEDQICGDCANNKWRQLLWNFNSTHSLTGRKKLTDRQCECDWVGAEIFVLRSCEHRFIIKTRTFPPARGIERGRLRYERVDARYSHSAWNETNRIDEPTAARPPPRGKPVGRNGRPASASMQMSRCGRPACWATVFIATMHWIPITRALHL